MEFHPHEQLVTLAGQRRLKDPGVLEQQVKRMLADPRSRALVDNFAGQWLFLRNLKNLNPDFPSRTLTTICGRPCVKRPTCSSRASSGKTAT